MQNDKDYFADKKHISRSMLVDYLKSPAYYKEKHVLGSIEHKTSPAMILGSAVDCYLTEGKKTFFSRYSQKQEEGKTRLTPAVYKQALSLSEAVLKTSAYKWIKKNAYLSQPILVGQCNGVWIKGKLDWLTLKGDTAYVDDLKTSKTIEPNKYYWHAKTYGYFLQAAFYRMLVLQNYQHISKVVVRHLVVSKEDWPIVKTFEISPAEMDAADILISETLMSIKAEVFKDPVVKWKGAEVIGGKYETI